MKEKIGELKELLKVKLEEMDITVDDIYFEVKDKNKFLTVVLDRVGGIDLDTIVNASHVVNKIVDEMDMPEENYILDVISKERG